MSAINWIGRSTSNPHCETSVVECTRGEFGWESCSKVIFPFINRSEKKYCSVRMLKVAVCCSEYSIQPEAMKTLMRKAVTATSEEVSLLDYINIQHCDKMYGKQTFSLGEHLVTVSDARAFVNFLEDCHKLCSDPSNHEQKGGFIRINKESIVPYVLIGGDKHVPLMYFKIVTKANLQPETLETKAMTEWDSCYMKFYSRIVGARNDYDFYGDHFVDLLNVTPYLSFYAEIEEYVPTEHVYKQFFADIEENVDSSNVANESNLCQIKPKTKRRYIKRNTVKFSIKHEAEPIDMKQKENTVPSEFDNLSVSDTSSLGDSTLKIGTKRIKNESEEARQMRLKKMRETARQQRLNETPEQREKRLVKLRMSQAKRLAKETPEQREKRLAKLRMYHILKKQRMEDAKNSL